MIYGFVSTAVHCAVIRKSFQRNKTLALSGVIKIKVK